MGVICVQSQYVFVGLDNEILWKNDDERPFNTLSVTPNLNNPNVSRSIKEVVSSDDGAYLAVLTSDKYILIYKSAEFTLHRQYHLPRAASKIVFSKDSQLLLVADKTGDALIYNISDVHDEGSKVLGHLSLLTDIIMTPDNKFIITCDRDEKIRVSNYPGTYNIESFCLGHKEFIVSIHLLPHDERYLLSTSGDGTVKLWEYLIGKEVYSLNVNSYVDNKDLITGFQKTMKEDDVEVECLPISHSSCCRKSETSSLLAISLHTHTAVLVFLISNIPHSPTLIDQIMMKDHLAGIAVTPDHLWLSLIGESVKLERWSLTETKYKLKRSEILVSESTNINHRNEITMLYKRKFDNLQEYQKRKKQRLGID